MFKKLLIAMACAGSAFNVLADTSHCANGEQVEFNACKPIYISAQGPVASGKTELDGTALAGNLDGSIRVNLNAEYAAGDTLTLTFTGVTLASADSVPEAVATGVQNGKMTLGLLSVDEHSVTYRVTELSADGAAPVSTLGAHINFSGLVFNNQELLNTKEASVRYAAITNKGAPLDNSDANTASLFKVINQFGYHGRASDFSSDSAIKFNPNYQDLSAIVDVNNERRTFVGDKTQVTAWLDLENNGFQSAGDGIKQRASVTKLEGAVYSDFTFLGEPNDKGVIETNKVDLPDFDVTLFKDRLVYSHDVSGPEQAFLRTENNLTIDISGADDKAADSPLAEQAFTLSTEVTYLDNQGQEHVYDLLDHYPYGQWRYNGSTTHVPFMPFRDDVSPIINVSNTSNMDGSISVRVYPDANDSTVVKDYSLPVAAKANAQTDITAALRALNIKGDVALDIIVAAPSANIAVNALYYSNGDRAVINTVDRSAKPEVK